MKNDKNAADVIIIGAGASGLAAASQLCKSGYNVLILEARGRCGGRIHTVEDSTGLLVEHGAEFVHGQQNRTEKIIREHKLKTRGLKGITYQKRDGKLIKDEDTTEQYWPDLLDELDKLSDDMAMGEFMRIHFRDEKYNQLRESVRQFAEGYDAADLDRASAFALRDEWKNQDDDEQSRIEGGYQQVVGALLDEVGKNGGKLELNSPVEQIRWTRGRVDVHVAGGREFTSSRIIITVPLGVLQHGDIKFTPPIVDHEKAFHQLGIGGVVKFLITFNPKFSENVINRMYPRAAFIFSDAEIPTWWIQGEKGAPLLTGWLSGPGAFTMPRTSENLHQIALSSLVYLFDVPLTHVRENITSLEIADWVSDPFSRGAYAYATVGSDKINEFITTPVENTLYFAGEAFYNGRSMGTVEAALDSGISAAMKAAGQSAAAVHESK